MDFLFTEDQQNIRDAILKLCSQYPDDYWLEQDQKAEFPEDFYRSLADAGWLGIAMPERFGGSGLGITEASIMMQAIAESGAGMSGASSVHINIFGLEPLILFGSEEQQQRAIPNIVAGADKACFAVTEPNVGLNTTQLKVRAERKDGGYLVNGEKIWISTAQVANKMLLLARTTPLDQIKRKTDGLSLFYTDFDRSKIETRLIHKMGRHAVDSNMLFIEDLWVPEADLIGEEGQGFKYILEGLNPERVLLAAEAIGLGRAAIKVDDRISISTVYRTVRLFEESGIIERHDFRDGRARYETSTEGKYLAGEFAFEACHTAMLSMGGMGYAQEYHVERYLRESLIPRTAPVSPHMILNFLAEKVLDLPKSY
ncbi:MAG: acyl-CoA/acyl-ACP dehydrogenase [Novosphingobium sp.]|nr:acyl-CoA/acyl-ACP dehydrogenase [Novosphingobium sp.]